MWKNVILNAMILGYITVFISSKPSGLLQQSLYCDTRGICSIFHELQMSWIVGGEKKKAI